MRPPLGGVGCEIPICMFTGGSMLGVISKLRVRLSFYDWIGVI